MSKRGAASPRLLCHYWPNWFSAWLSRFSRGDAVTSKPSNHRTTMNPEQHYDAEYFGWQRSIGQFSAKANLFKFQPHVKPTDRVVDFGCGGAYLLAALECAERRGIEVNPIARSEAARIGVECFASAEDLPDEWADVVISNRDRKS